MVCARVVVGVATRFPETTTRKRIVREWLDEVELSLDAPSPPFSYRCSMAERFESGEHQWLAMS